MDKNTVTLRDIALAAHVSLGAVSKVLGRSKGNIRISDEKADLIRRTAAALNYKPNISARRLAGGASRVIGIILDSELPVHYYRTVTSIEHKLEALEYRTMVAESHGSVENFQNAHRSLMQYGVDGVICISHDYPGENHLIEEYFRHYPNTVFIGRPFAGTHLVDIDWRSSTESATAHLLSCGCRSLVLLIGKTPYVSRADRISGFQQAVNACSGVHSAIMQLSALDSEEIPPEFPEIIKSLPQDVDGIICENDLKAVAMIGQLQRMGIRVPEDIAVVGHNNEQFSSCHYPAVSTIDELSGAQAEAAVELLLRQLGENPPASPQTITITPSLILRESSQFPARK